MKIALGNDHVGRLLRKPILLALQQQGMEVIDFGSDEEQRVYSPEVAEKVAMAVRSGQADRGILVCGSGAGMCIAANKVNGIRAVVCSEPYTAKMSREHNNTTILCLGSRVVGSELAIMILVTWLNSVYEGGDREIRHQMIAEIESHQWQFAADSEEKNS